MNKELIAEARKAHNAAGRMPQGFMRHEDQWVPFADLYNVVDRLIDALEAAEAKLQAVRDLHRKFTYYELEDSCPDISEEHREEYHHQSYEIGEFYCEKMPTGDVACVHCRNDDGERMDWPCPTVEALGDVS